MKEFFDLNCDECRTHFIDLNTRHGWVAAATAFAVAGTCFHMSPWEATRVYFKGYHNRGHVEADPSNVSPETARIAALFDETPTAEDVEAADRSRVQPHAFERFMTSDICQHGAMGGAGAFCGLGETDPIHTA